jgi:hypothetical protein
MHSHTVIRYIVQHKHFLPSSILTVWPCHAPMAPVESPKLTSKESMAIITSAQLILQLAHSHINQLDLDDDVSYYDGSHRYIIGTTKVPLQ